MEETTKKSGYAKVSVIEKAGYGIASGGGNIITQILSTFLTSYLTDSVGVAVAAVGTMMLVARFFDGASDIIMGSIIDKTKSKWGKARPWLLIIKGFCAGFLFSCGFAMASDVVDYGEWQTGIRSEGLINSCVSFGQKVGLGLGSTIVSWVLAFGGYDGTAAEQTSSALGAINFGFSYYGMILSLGIAVIALFMNIDKHADEIRRDLEAKH